MFCIVKRQKPTVAFSAIFSAILATFTIIAQASAQPEMLQFNHADKGISLSYPSMFTQIPPPSPQVLIFLRPPEGRYPTLNILSQVGNPKVEESGVSKLRADVVDSYRAVGLYDAEVVQGEKREVAGRTVFYARVAYKNKGEALNSGVYILPTKESYFVLTYVDTEGAFSQSSQLLEDIVKTIKLRDAPPEPTSGRDFTELALWFGAILALLILAKIVMMVLSAIKK